MEIELKFKGTKKERESLYILFTFMKNYIIIIIIFAIVLGIIALIKPELLFKWG